jgi:phosphoglycerate dehydrogenase-like enzyme
MFAQSRQLPAALGTVCASGTPEWNHLRSASRSLQGQRVVILGYGSIAGIVVDLLRPLQMQVVRDAAQRLAATRVCR